MANNVNDYLKEAEKANVAALNAADKADYQEARIHAMVAKGYAEMAKAAAMRDA